MEMTIFTTHGNGCTKSGTFVEFRLQIRFKRPSDYSEPYILSPRLQRRPKQCTHRADFPRRLLPKTLRQAKVAGSKVGRRQSFGDTVRFDWVPNLNATQSTRTVAKNWPLVEKDKLGLSNRFPTATASTVQVVSRTRRASVNHKNCSHYGNRIIKRRE
jgi:hypothetical protein